MFCVELLSIDFFFGCLGDCPKGIHSPLFNARTDRTIGVDGVDGEGKNRVLE